MKTIRRVLGSIYFDVLLAALAVAGFIGPFLITKHMENNEFLVLSLFLLWFFIIILLFVKSILVEEEDV